MKDTKHERTPATPWPLDQQQPMGGSPGQTGNTPGQSGQTPGQSGQTPGQSGMNPGQGGAEATDSQWRPKDKQPKLQHQTGEAQKPNAG